MSQLANATYLIIQDAFKIKNKRIDKFFTVILFYNWIYILWMSFI